SKPVPQSMQNRGRSIVQPIASGAGPVGTDAVTRGSAAGVVVFAGETVDDADGGTGRAPFFFNRLQPTANRARKTAVTTPVTTPKTPIGFSKSSSGRTSKLAITASTRLRFPSTEDRPITAPTAHILCRSLLANTAQI